MTITATAIGYDAVHPLPARLADQSGNGLDMVVGLTFIVAFATAGALLAWKRPRNPIGWLLSGSGLAYALGGFGQLLIHFPRTRTARPLAGLDLAAGPGAVRVRRAVVPGRAPAVPPLAAGGLGRRGRPGRLGAGQRVRPHDQHGRPAGRRTRSA